MEQKLRQLIKEAMIEKNKSGNINRYQTLKNILEKAQKSAKDQRVDTITDTMIIDASKKEIKQLEDLLSYCKEGMDKYAETVECIGYAKELLPKMTSVEEIKTFLYESDIEKNMGICMKSLKEKFGDALDGKLASNVVKEYISK